ncbi:thiamine pyrophosphate-dependent dehydrogenase E1 component subunit alpha [Bacillus sp. MRMR6]|uniref:thiamine pyrophosphate-dependent dehydrogenase E1 component subunit alpha n=1 Tax=Bacillus sp. MRMR6 TaxID=1928617 RepID=UPI0009535CA6|nr:thiamine pyrophosphate-dependent dehydrogenase E1 component subunit alpha [Bacillus sp. MRMR6]OLS33772.1 hypothetical protein BTR25_24055 [Bacillus sp. MRMR6]
MSYTKEEYLEIYKMLSFSRLFGEITVEYVMKGILPGFHHPGLGEEALMVGIFSELGTDDWIVPQHRCRPMMAWKLGKREYVKEILGRKGGINGGMSGDSHFFVPEKKVGPYDGLLGQAQALAAGVALNYKMNKTNGCVVIGAGDGTMNEGVVAEALNIIAAWKLPVVWYIQNNGYGMSMKPEEATGLRDLSQRGEGFGLLSSTYDGVDVFLVKEVMREAMARARKGEPSLVEFRTTRWTGHFIGDPTVYRDQTEVAVAKANRDPIKWNRNFMLAHNLASEDQLNLIDEELRKEVYSIFDDSLEAPIKSRADVSDLSKVFAGGDFHE